MGDEGEGSPPDLRRSPSSALSPRCSTSCTCSVLSCQAPLEGRSRLAFPTAPQLSTAVAGPLAGDHTAGGGCCSAGLQNSGSSGGGGGSANPGGASDRGASASQRETRAGAPADECGRASGAGSAPDSSGGGCCSMKPSSSGGGTGVPAGGDAAPLPAAEEAPPMPTRPRSHTHPTL